MRSSCSLNFNFYCSYITIILTVLLQLKLFSHKVRNIIQSPTLVIIQRKNKCIRTFLLLCSPAIKNNHEFLCTFLKSQMVYVLFYFFHKFHYLLNSISLFPLGKEKWCNKHEVKSGIRWKSFEDAHLICNYERDRVGLGIL